MNKLRELYPFRAECIRFSYFFNETDTHTRVSVCLRAYVRAGEERKSRSKNKITYQLFQQLNQFRKS